MGRNYLIANPFVFNVSILNLPCTVRVCVTFPMILCGALIS